MNAKTKCNILLLTVSGALLISSAGCSTYKVADTDSIKPVIVTEAADNTSIDYSELNFLEEIEYYKSLTWQEAIDEIDSPEEAQHYLDTFF